MHKSTALLLASLAIVCSGCYESRPEIRQASVTYWQGGKPKAAQELSPSQVKQLNLWLASHRWGWHPVLASYLPATQISIVFTDDMKESANVMSSIVILGRSQRNISAEEHDELMGIIHGEN